MKYLEKFLKTTGQNNNPKDGSNDLSKVSVVSVSGTGTSKAPENNKKPCKANLGLPYKTTEAAKLSVNNTTNPDPATVTAEVTENLSFHKCALAQPTAPTVGLIKQADCKLNRVFIDFETQSEADLDKVGSILYSEHPSTDVLCVVILDANSNGESIVLTANDIKAGSQLLTNLVRDKNNIFVAHNAAFDQAIWANVMVKKYGYPEIPIKHWRCTMAKAYAHGLPGSLEDAAIALTLPIQKDMEGKANMLKLSKPKKIGGFWTLDEKPELFEQLYSYCRTDVEITKLIDSRLPDLNDKEQELWFIDQRMNQEGINIDLGMVKKANNIVDNHKLTLEKQLEKVTNGAVNKPTERQKLLLWLQTRNVKLKNTKAPTIAEALNSNNLPADVKEVLLIHQEGTKSSLKKYKTMLDRADSHGRIRGDLLQYNAAHTGRWGGRGIQLHNLPKPKIKIEPICEAISTLPYEDFSGRYGTDIAHVLSQSIRGAVVPSKNKKFFIGDFAQIEARVLAWLAGEQKALDIFAEGEDLYCIEASRIYGWQITKEAQVERGTGKVAVLALGYGGGIGSLVNFANKSGLELKPIYESLWPTASEEEKNEANRSWERYQEKPHEPISKEEGLVADLIKQRWRNNNPNIVKFWECLEDAAINAVISGRPEPVAGLHFYTEKEFLYCKLPSGRCMAYPYPLVKTNGYGRSTLSYQSANKGREDTWGGTLAENVTQAIQRDLLVDAIFRLEDSPYKVIFHVHDEIIAEGEPGLNLDEFKSLMSQVPQWASGLPIGVDAKISDRFC